MKTFEIKLGDKVIVRSRNNKRISEVSGATKLCWRVDGSLYYKDDYRLRGGSQWQWSVLDEWSQSKEDEIRMKELSESIAYKLECINLYNLSPSKLIAIQKILDEKETK